MAFARTLDLLGVGVRFNGRFDGAAPLASGPVGGVAIKKDISHNCTSFAGSIVDIATSTAHTPILVMPILKSFGTTTGGRTRTVMDCSTVLVPRAVTRNFEIRFRVSNGVCI